MSFPVRMTFDGRLPSNTRCATSAPFVPSAWTSSAVLPNASALGLRKYICHQNVVMPAQLGERVAERDEVARDQPRALMDELIERVLAVRAGFAPVNRAGLVIHFFAGERDVLAVALHRQLLEIRGKAFQVLFVRQNGHGLSAEEVSVPD